MQAALSRVQLPGTFAFVRDDYAGPPPTLTVLGVGNISLPLRAHQTAQLLATGEAAPYGKGHDTVLDPAVRKATQLDAARLAFGPGWVETLKSITQDVAKRLLGADGSSLGCVEARLYKLLLYERGGHFVAHRDTEKEPGMFGTLLVQLPVAGGHAGGVLRVRHGGKQVVWDTAADSDAHAAESGGGGGVKAGHRDGRTVPLRYAAFFADCEHELQPVTAGLRVVLAYNLVRTAPGPTPSAAAACTPSAEAAAAVEALQAAVRQWEAALASRSGDPSSGMMAAGGTGIAPAPPDPALLLRSIPLEHRYTETNLSFRNLKGRDAAVVGVLRSCGLLDVHLALVTKKLTGTTFGYQPYHKRRRRGCWGYDDDDAEDDDDGAAATMDEVHEEEISTETWVSPSGRKADVGHLATLAYDNLLGGSDSLFAGDAVEQPDEREYEGYMGNYGPTLQYWYHRAVVVVWPRSRAAAVSCAAGFSAALDVLASRLAAVDRILQRHQAEGQSGGAVEGEEDWEDECEEDEYEDEGEDEGEDESGSAEDDVHGDEDEEQVVDERGEGDARAGVPDDDPQLKQESGQPSGSAAEPQSQQGHAPGSSAGAEGQPGKPQWQSGQPEEAQAGQPQRGAQELRLDEPEVVQAVRMLEAFMDLAAGIAAKPAHKYRCLGSDMTDADASRGLKLLTSRPAMALVRALLAAAAATAIVSLGGCPAPPGVHSPEAAGTAAAAVEPGASLEGGQRAASAAAGISAADAAPAPTALSGGCGGGVSASGITALPAWATSPATHLVKAMAQHGTTGSAAAVAAAAAALPADQRPAFEDAVAALVGQHVAHNVAYAVALATEAAAPETLRARVARALWSSALQPAVFARMSAYNVRLLVRLVFERTEPHFQAAAGDFTAAVLGRPDRQELLLTLVDEQAVMRAATATPPLAAGAAASGTATRTQGAAAGPEADVAAAVARAAAVLVLARSRHLEQVASRCPPVRGWEQPKATLPGYPQVEAFLRGPVQSATFTGLFGGIVQARRWCDQHFGRNRYGISYSATAVAGGTGRGAYATVTKNLTMHEREVQSYQAVKMSAAAMAAQAARIPPHIATAAEALLPALLRAPAAAPGVGQVLTTAAAAAAAVSARAVHPAALAVGPGFQAPGACSVAPAGQPNAPLHGPVARVALQPTAPAAQWMPRARSDPAPGACEVVDLTDG